MATSGVTTFATTRDDIIRQAALMVGAVGANVAMQSRIHLDFAFMLNAIVKRWQAKGIHLWTVSEATLFPEPGQIMYTAGTGATDHIAETVYDTTLDGAEATGQTTLSVTSTTNMTVGDKIGVLLDDNTWHWSTISSLVAGDTVTIADALPSDAASGSEVFWYTANIARPLKITDYRSEAISDGTVVPLTLSSRFHYNGLSGKETAGSFQHAFYETRLNTGNIYLYQVPSTVTHLVKFTWWKPIEIFSTGANSPDLPAEQVQALIFNLAFAMSPQYPARSAQQVNNIKEQALLYEAQLAGWDREMESVEMAPANEPQ